jgi:hypothetical protein
VFVPFEAELEDADGHLDFFADAGMFDVEEVGEAGAFGLGIADDDDLGAPGQFGEFSNRLFGLRIEALHAFAGEADGLLVLGAELVNFRPRELLNVGEDRVGRVDAAGIGQAVEVAFGLLLDFRGFDEPDDGVLGEIGQEAGLLVEGPVGAVAERDKAGFGDVTGGAEGFDIKVVDGFDLVAEEINADGVSACVVVAG